MSLRRASWRFARTAFVNQQLPPAIASFIFPLPYLLYICFHLRSIPEIFPHFPPSNILFHWILFLSIMSRKSLYFDNLLYQIFPERRETCTSIYLLHARRKLELVESCKCCNSTLLMRTRYYSVCAFLLEERFSVCSRTLRGYLVRELKKQRPGKNHSIRR